jgi:hypothetical protein
MKRHVLLILTAALLCLLWSNCSKETSIVTASSGVLVADMRYYPTFPETVWRYRIDTTSPGGGMVINTAQRVSRITGTQDYNGLRYTVQVDENTDANGVTFDTLFVRKSDSGLYVTSPALRTLGRLPGFPGLNISIPSEFLLFPYPLETAGSWQLIDIEFNQIPLFPIYVRVNASRLGRESAVTSAMTFKDCQKVQFRVDARLPNPQDPTNFLNPLVIREDATFYFARPLGLVMGDGSQLLFTLLTGQIPTTQSRKRVHAEATFLDIVQPNDPCGNRGKQY